MSNWCLLISLWISFGWGWEEGTRLATHLLSKNQGKSNICKRLNISYASIIWVFFWICWEHMMLQGSCIHATFHAPGWDEAPSFTHVMIPIPEHPWCFPNCQLSQSSWLGWIFGKWPSVKKSQNFHLCKLDACKYFFIICKHFLFWVTMAEMATLSFKINQHGANTFLSPSLSPCLFPPFPHPLNPWWITLLKNLYLI